MRGARDVIIRPMVSEKSYAGLEGNRYTFLVDPGSNKTEIKEAVQSIFGVKVANVNTMIRKGKKKRFGLTMGQRKNTKRAIVTLAEGETIDIFAGGL